MSIILEGNYVLIQPDNTEELTTGGIYMAKKKTPDTGRIISISKDADASIAVVGDRVKYLPNGRIEYEDGTVSIKADNILWVE